MNCKGLLLAVPLKEVGKLSCTPLLQHTSIPHTIVLIFSDHLWSRHHLGFLWHIQHSLQGPGWHGFFEGLPIFSRAHGWFWNQGSNAKYGNITTCSKTTKNNCIWISAFLCNSFHWWKKTVFGCSWRESCKRQKSYAGPHASFKLLWC